MVDNQDADSMFIGYFLQLTDDFIIIGITELVPQILPYLLQSIDNDQPGIWIALNEILHFIAQAFLQVQRSYAEDEGGDSVFNSEHPSDPALDSGEIILQSKAEDSTLTNLPIP